MNDSILYNYLSGKATDEEMVLLRDWLKESPAHQTQFFDLKAVWYAQRTCQTVDEAQVNDSLARLNDQIDRMTGTKRQSSIGSWLRYGSIAAVALLCIALSYLYLYNREANPANQESFVTFTNVADEYTVKTVHLPDGTTVWLRANARLTAPAVFNQDNRIVTLDGEAFFEVKKDSVHPFIVRTDSYEVQVVGTSFNVNTRKQTGVSETILISGSVRLQRKEGECLTMLRPGQQALYTTGNGRIEVHEVDANSLTAWRFGVISLSDVTAVEVIRCLENVYNTKIQLDISSLKDRHYNFSFQRNHPLKTVLEQFLFITGLSTQEKAAQYELP